ncbi:nicotinate (nicotinamide) nucleotide adenylyltransferase [Persicirhabdus sediminis]|uniref:Probable nicotinate-nucleotide adenylyltransferase n=1 Tax=Persicirhabdus sediminis TaxID=454144 RepID=A0A8J7MEN2_9BACT|nr:nicotinate (nicotinamide) nucleotide adenylyltransferase [Persicirhabdus sediminis]MBK1791317.1 nicotinate (nicotinamide) nucleotide adenylyltransferase [Persicirhabdus sediminis]
MKNEKFLTKKSICLFGGTFDPIHQGHLQIAQAAVDECSLDHVIFLPCRQSPHKSTGPAASDVDRLAMCQRATQGLDWAIVEDLEFTIESPSYSWRTVEEIKKKYGDHHDYYWLMGTDQWHALERWNRYDYLASLLDFIVYSRGDRAQNRAGLECTPIHGDHPASSTEIRHQLATGQPANWLAENVQSYITDRKLYATVS